MSYGHRWPKKARDVLNHQVDQPSKDLKNRNHERSCAMLIPCPSKILLSSYCTHSNHIGWYSCELFHSHCCCELDHLELFFFERISNSSLERVVAFCHRRQLFLWPLVSPKRDPTDIPALLKLFAFSVRK